MAGNNNDDNEESVHIRVTGKQIGIILVAIAGLTGWYPVANYVNSDVRFEAFTSSDGNELDDRITIIEFEIGIIKKDDASCAERARQLVKKIDRHSNIFSALRYKVYEFQTKTNAENRSRDELIRQCMASRKQ